MSGTDSRNNMIGESAKAAFNRDLKEWCRENGIGYVSEPGDARSSLVDAFLKAQPKGETPMDGRTESDVERDRAQAEELRMQSMTRAIPTIYRDAELSDFDGSVKARLDGLLKGRSALVLGGNGVGKTRLGWALCKALWREGRTADLMKAQVLLSRVKGKDDPYGYIEHTYGRQSCLVIDEMDKIFESRADFVYMNYLVDFRYEWRRQTVVLGNGDARRFVEALGQSIYSRLTGDGGMGFTLSGRDWRKGKGNAD